MTDCDSRPPSSVETRQTPVRLRIRFLVPLTLVLLVISGLFVAQMYMHQREMVSAQAQRLQQALSQLYRQDI